MVTSAINTSGITIGSDGKVRISGLSSSIDWKGIIDAQVKAKRTAAVTLETKTATNNTLVTAYGELKTKTLAITNSLNVLRAAPGSTVDVFNAKTASGTTAPVPTAASGYVPSDINTLLLTSIGTNAQAGTHTIRIREVAAAQQIRTDAVASTTSALAGLGVTTGTFTINGQTITLSATDTLQDLRAAINTADAGVNATIVSASPTSHYLVLTSSETGTANEIDFAGGNATSDSLGLTAAGVVKTELTQAKDALLDVNGITGITRSKNEIDDIITGVTLSLLKAETDTNITLKVAPDLNKIKTAINDFVTAYNDVRTFATAQRTASDRNNDGTIEDNEVGPLAYDQRMRDIVSRLSVLSATSIDSNTDGFRSLSQLGITINESFQLEVDDTILDSRLLNDVDSVKTLFGFTSSTSDSRAVVLARTADTVAGTYYMNIGGTDGSGNITSANIKSALVVGNGGADDGSATVSEQQVTGATGDSTGLKIFFNGAPGLGAQNDIRVTISRGLADQFYDYFNEATKTTVGMLDTATSELLTINKDYADRIDVIDTRLETFRAQQERKFTAMETALSRLENLKNTINSFFSTSNTSSSN
jgi:flagellar hook-associated protein 2